MRIPVRPKVILRSCREYDPEKIRTIIREGLDELGLRPFGRTLVKPNLVASGPLFPNAYTRPEFTEGVLRALRDRDHARGVQGRRVQRDGRPCRRSEALLLRRRAADGDPPVAQGAAPRLHLHA